MRTLSKILNSVSEDTILLWALGIAVAAALVMDLGFDKGWW